MTYYVFSIVTIFRTWACHVMYVESLSKILISQDILLDFRKSHKI